MPGPWIPNMSYINGGNKSMLAQLCLENRPALFSRWRHSLKLSGLWFIARDRLTFRAIRIANEGGRPVQNLSRCANTSSYSKTSRYIDVWFYNSSEAKNCVHDDDDDDDGSLYQFDQWSSTGFASDFTWTSQYSITNTEMYLNWHELSRGTTA